MKRGILIGKFCPLHIGHMSLIKFASSMVDELIVLVDCHESYDLGIDDRCKIIKQTFPTVITRGIYENTLQTPDESPDFWDYWNKLLKKYVPEDIHVIIGSMGYVKNLAQGLNCEYLIFDTERNGLGISATMIRNDIEKYWDYLAPESKPYYLRNIAIVGAESSGKSTISKELANYYNTIQVPEYARVFIEHNDSTLLTPENLDHIAQAQLLHGKTLQTFARHFLFYDTDAVTTQCWYKLFFNKTSNIIEEEIKKQKFDLYILMPVLEHWEEDIVRYQPKKEEREKFYKDLKQELINRNLNFIEIESQDKFAQLQECVKKLKSFRLN